MALCACGLCPYRESMRVLSYSIFHIIHTALPVPASQMDLDEGHVTVRPYLKAAWAIRYRKPSVGGPKS